ncbi:MAG: hypothetical protein IH612_02625 [Desulfofustis sp.]|nr:hypothetical protein [Desulfofustis sp.]
MTQELVERVCQTLGAALGRAARFRSMGGSAGSSADGELVVSLPEGQVEWVRRCVVKNRLPAYTGALPMMLRQQGEDAPLLITDYVNPRQAERLKNAGVEFLDRCGNGYLNQPPLYYYVTGHRPDKLVSPGNRTPRLFNKSGLRVVYALLCDQELVSGTFREIAALAGVSLGTLHIVLKDLEAAGFLVTLPGGGRSLVRTRHLVERWVTAYPEGLRPKIARGTFRCASFADLITQDLPAGFFWGGDVAARRLTGTLRPETGIIYCQTAPVELIKEKRLYRDPAGTIDLYDAFWRAGGAEGGNHEQAGVVHPLLVYADLLASGDARNVEVAQEVYERYLARSVGED